MRLPNSFGSVYKLSGKRRKPWAARKTVGWKEVPERRDAYPVYEFIGYYATRAEALQALGTYNENPVELDLKNITFEEVYNQWSEQYYKKLKSVRHYQCAYEISKPLWKMQFADIRLAHLQKVINESGKNTPMLKNVKLLWGMMYDYAIINEIVGSDKKSIVHYVDINTGNPNTREHKPFLKADVEAMWNYKDDPDVSIVLMLIYSGARIGELLELKKEDVHLDERYFYVKESKTAAGVREVPIAEKVVPLYEYWLSQPSEYLICSNSSSQMIYNTFLTQNWTQAMKTLNLSGYTPHCTRHTCISLMTQAGVDERIIQKIVGHKGSSVTQVVYTHIELPSKLEAINKI